MLFSNAPAMTAPAGDDDGRVARLLKRIQDEVLTGLKGCKVDLDEALQNQAFWDLEGERYIPARESETPFDYAGREKRLSGFQRKCIDVLTEDLYCPGPSRTFDDPAAEEFLRRVWDDNLIDSLMHEADQLSHVNRVCAIQVDAGEGDFENRPVSLRMWGREEFQAWTHPDDVTKVVAVVTIDRVDLTTRYRLWTDAEVRTYETRKAEGTSGGTAPVFVRAVPNTYGCIPFGFFWYELPLRQFFPSSIGTFLTKTEVRIDDRLSRIDESINKHLNPIPVAENAPPGFQPFLSPQRFITLTGEPQYGDGGYRQGQTPRLYYLQAKPDVEAAWHDLMLYANGALETARVPLTAVRMEQSGTASGIALVVEQLPLAKRARKRRTVAAYAEAYLTRVILTACGTHYGRPGLVSAAAKGRLTLGWPQPTIPVPGPDRDEVNRNAIELGTKSRLMVVQEEYGCSRDQAIEILKQIAEDRRLEDEIDPPPAKPEAPGVEDKTEGDGEGDGEGPADVGGPSDDDSTDEGDDE